MMDSFLDKIKPTENLGEPLEPKTEKQPFPGPPSTLAGDNEIKPNPAKVFEGINLLLLQPQFWDVPGNLDKILSLQDMLEKLTLEERENLFKQLGLDKQDQWSALRGIAMKLKSGHEHAFVAVAKRQAETAA